MNLTSTKIIRNYIDVNIKEFDRTVLETKSEYIGVIDNKNTDIIALPSGEEVVVGYVDISITGTERAKPQIRVFMDKTREAYQYAKKNQKRFFLLTIFSKENSMAKNIVNYDPHDYVLAIETNIDNETSRRDLRSMFDYLDSYLAKGKKGDFVRCANGCHQSGIYQGAFIKIRENGIDKPDTLVNYITFFDSRPYMNSITDDAMRGQKAENDMQFNRIVFGAPGTGKSHLLERDSKVFGNNVERVTFHPNYSYANFVGTYKPTMIDDRIDWLVDDEKKKIMAILQDKTKTAQEKYDLLYDKFKGEGLTRLPLLLGIYTDEAFKTRKMDGTDAIGDNNVERNHGKAIRPYLNLSLKNSSKEISYEYVPGPFMRIYTQAINHPEEKFLLLIEEINRANVAAVFGDVFQLLDRKNGVSEYPIATSEDVKVFLKSNLECLKNKKIDEFSDEESRLYQEMRIPNNMFIWATMNSADQGVFPMDTAFKRRWEFEYIGVNDAAKEVEKYIIPIGDKDHRRYVRWNDLRERINDILLSDDCKVNEDKLLGPFFISKNMLESACENEERFIKAFESKVIMYLFEDAVKMRPQNIFREHKGKMTFSEVCKTFEQEREVLFGINDIEYIYKEEQE